MLEEKLLTKYKNLILSKCPVCSKEMKFNPTCKSCFNKLTKTSEFIRCGVPLKYVDLDISVFEKTKDKNVTVQYKRKEIYTKIQKYINDLKQNILLGKGVLFTGGFGTGKSTLSMNIAKNALEYTKKVRIREFSEMVRISQTGMSIEDSSPADILQELIINDVYCIENLDWVYSKQNSDYVKMFFDNVISLAAKYSTVLIITSNMGIEDIKTEFNEHVYSVLHEICDIYSIPGSDIRQNKK